MLSPGRQDYEWDHSVPPTEVDATTVYSQAGCDDGSYRSDDSPITGALTTRAKEIAAAQGKDVDSYDRVLYVFPKCGLAWLGLGAVGGAGSWVYVQDNCAGRVDTQSLQHGGSCSAEDVEHGDHNVRCVVLGARLALQAQAFIWLIVSARILKSWQ